MKAADVTDISLPQDFLPFFNLERKFYTCACLLVGKWEAKVLNYTDTDKALGNINEKSIQICTEGCVCIHVC